MDKLELQNFLFSTPPPKRLDLLNYKCSENENVQTVYVCRNHSFELIEHTIAPYLEYAMLPLSFEYSDYDDSFSFSQLNTDADLVVLWVDCKRYSGKEVGKFLAKRLVVLRQIFKKNILVVPTEPVTLDQPGSGVCILNLASVRARLGERFYDERLESASGSRLSAKALLEISKELGLRYFPALLQPALKAIVLDLDNTLYSGVLGEDGPMNLLLDKGHIKLQERLVELGDSGLFLCVASKNDADDVKNLFELRQDFPLKWEMLAKVCASWHPKYESIKEIGSFLNIHESSILFIDDNFGELVSVLSACPEIKEIHAYADASRTLEVLNFYPGMLRLAARHEDSLRTGDIQANANRQRRQAAMSSEDYLQSLNMEVTLKINDSTGVARISELANKTNQFVFNYRRYSEPEVEDLLKCDSTVIITLFLKDNLSDSGMIGACFLKREGNHAVLEELFVSCRALGRGIDDMLIFNAISAGLKKLQVGRFKAVITKGERNTPALMFFEKYFAEYAKEASLFKAPTAQSFVTVNIQGDV